MKSVAFLSQSPKISGRVLRNSILKQTEFYLQQLNCFATHFASELIAFPWHADSPVLLFYQGIFCTEPKECILLLVVMPFCLKIN